MFLSPAVSGINLFLILPPDPYIRQRLGAEEATDYFFIHAVGRFFLPLQAAALNGVGRLIFGEGLPRGLEWVPSLIHQFGTETRDRDRNSDIPQISQIVSSSKSIDV